MTEHKKLLYAYQYVLRRLGEEQIEVDTREFQSANRGKERDPYLGLISRIAMEDFRREKEELWAEIQKWEEAED